MPGKSHGWRSLVGCRPWGRKESDTTERLHFHFSLSCIGEGNGNPLQCSCLENPRDWGAWWAAVYWVAQSRTRLKRLSSSSSSLRQWCDPKQTLGAGHKGHSSICSLKTHFYPLKMASIASISHTVLVHSYPWILLCTLFSLVWLLMSAQIPCGNPCPSASRHA